MKEAKGLFVKAEGGKWRATWLFRLLFLVSATAMTLGLSIYSGWAMVATRYTVPASSVVLCWLVFRHRLPERLFAVYNKRIGVLSAVFAVFAVYEYAAAACYRLSSYANKLPTFALIERGQLEALFFAGLVLVFVCSVPAVFAALYAFYTRLAAVAGDWRRAADRIEKGYLLGAGLVFSLEAVLVFAATNVFYGANYVSVPDPETGGAVEEWIPFDIIYTTDSPAEVDSNVYFFTRAPINDLRNLLFALFAAPFAIPCLLLARLLFFWPAAYPLMINIVQILLMLTCVVMFARMLRLQGGAKILFLLAASSAYPVLLHLFAMGQYVFASFWLVLFVYAHTTGKEWDGDCLIAASGSLVTSAALFPLLLRDKPVKAWGREIGLFCGKFAALTIVFGQLSVLAALVAASVTKRGDIGHGLDFYLMHAGSGVGFADRALQFLGFVATCFVKPAAAVGTFGRAFVSYQLAPVTSVNALGFVLLALALAGYALNRQELWAKIAMIWLAYSFIVLCLIGWGTPENGLVIYSLYFGWPYFILVFMCAERALAKWKNLRYAIYIAATAALVVVNGLGIADLIGFAVTYYPLK
ncbi:MAG: hypothetical protein LBI54_00505 [Lachnospiraceae bacterium]|jgi:hypothetical protein|nr:hypothetical protein [Lachnospiraceae bacterium]